MSKVSSSSQLSYGATNPAFSDVDDSDITLIDDASITGRPSSGDGSLTFRVREQRLNHTTDDENDSASLISSSEYSNEHESDATAHDDEDQMKP